MQHEIILALLGCPGDIVNDDFRVNEAVGFVALAEREAINNIVVLGRCYEFILGFIDIDLAFEHSADRGLYCMALKNGLEEQLEEYRALVTATESDMIADERPLSHIQFKLREAQYHLTLPALMRVVELVTRPRRPIHGAHILELLHEEIASGPVAVKR